VRQKMWSEKTFNNHFFGLSFAVNEEPFHLGLPPMMFLLQI
jgi:hypothetical protein